MRVERRQVQVLLDTAQPRLELADDDATPDDGGVVFDERAAQPDDLLAEVLARVLVFGGLPRFHCQQVGGDIRAEGVHLRSDVGDVGLGRHVGAYLRHVGAHVAQQLQDEVFRSRAHRCNLSPFPQPGHRVGITQLAPDGFSAEVLNGAYRAALEEWTRERVPLDWAATQNNLGDALSTLGERERGTDRLTEAVNAYQAALDVFTPETASDYHDGTTANLNHVLGEIARRDLGANATVDRT